MSYTKVIVLKIESENLLEFKDAASGEPLDNNDMLYILLDDGSYKQIGDCGEVSFSSDLEHVKNGSETFGTLEALLDKIYKGPYQDITSDAVNPGYISSVSTRSTISEPGLEMRDLAAAPRRRRPRQRNGPMHRSRFQTRVAARRRANQRVRSRNNQRLERRQRRVVVVARRSAASNRRRPNRLGARRTRQSLQTGK